MRQSGTVYPCLRTGINSNPLLWGLGLKKFLHMLCFQLPVDTLLPPASTFSLPAISCPFLTKLEHPANSIIMLLFQTTLKHKAKQTKISESWRSNVARDLTLRKRTRVSSSQSAVKLGKLSSSLASCIAGPSGFFVQNIHTVFTFRGKKPLDYTYNAGKAVYTPSLINPV